MNVIRRNNELIIQIPDDLPFSYLDELIGYLNVKAILSKSEATDEDIELLTEQIKADWWARNKNRFIREINS